MIEGERKKKKENRESGGSLQREMKERGHIRKTKSGRPGDQTRYGYNARVSTKPKEISEQRDERCELLLKNGSRGPKQVVVTHEGAFF